MRSYYTLVQPLFTEDRDLEEYLKNQGVKFKLGADRQEELVDYGFTISNDGKIHPVTGNREMIATYVVLLDEADLSAIKLSIPEVQIIKNRTWPNFVNTVRGWFSWFLD